MYREILIWSFEYVSPSLTIFLSLSVCLLSHIIQCLFLRDVLTITNYDLSKLIENMTDQTSLCAGILFDWKSIFSVYLVHDFTFYCQSHLIFRKHTTISSCSMSSFSSVLECCYFSEG